MSLCDQYEVILLEDVCESMGSKYQGEYLGTFGLASFYSMYFGHHISTIEGGFINTDDEDFYHLLLMIRSHGWDRDLPKWKQTELRNNNSVSDFGAFYNFYVPGMNLRATDLQAFLGLRAIDKLDDYSIKRRNNFLKFKSNLKNSSDIYEEERSGDFISNFALPYSSIHRAALVKRFQEVGVEVRPLIAGNMANKPMWDKTNTDLPNANHIDEYGFYLPNHQDLTDEDIQIMTDILNSVKVLSH